MPTRVGVLLVHGIGEQRRFEHLEGEVRHIAAALKADDRVRSSRVVIHTSPTAAFAAEHQTWRAEDVAPVMVEVTRDGGEVTEIHFREVWWADLDEPATLWTQIKFWSWGLSMWSLRGHLKSGYGKWMRPPDNVDEERPKVSWWGRLRLFVVGMIFLLILLTVSLANLVLRRFPTLDLPGPDILVNYIGDVKLFQQKKRVGKGPLLDIGQPPRVTLRRRMVQALVYMAMESYDRWYLLAHSQGTVLAFNGLMETQQALPNYLDQQLWQDCESAIGAKTNPPLTPDEISKMMPRRPAWLRPEDGIDRRVLFAKLKGVMTYGSPLEKFAVLWPAVVPLNRDEAVFPDGFEWINVFDKTDPVADRLKSFDPKSSGAKPRNLSYKAKSVHLLSHINYLTFKAGKDNRLVNVVASWFLQGGDFPQPTSSSLRWPGPVLTAVYDVARYLIWIAGGLVLAAILGQWFGWALRTLLGSLPGSMCGGDGGCVSGYDSLISSLLDAAPLSWVVTLLAALSAPEFLVKAMLYIIGVALVVLIAGLGKKLRHWFGGRTNDA